MAKFLYIFMLLIVCDIIGATDPSTSSIAADPSTSNTSEEPSKPGNELLTLTSVQHEIYRGKRSLLQFREDEETELEPQCLAVIYEENNETKFYRDCYYAEDETKKYPAEVCSEEIGSGGTIKICQLCTKDLCNTSGKVATSMFLIIAGLISTYFYFNIQARFLI